MKIVNEVIALRQMNESILQNKIKNGNNVENINEFDLSEYQKKVKSLFDEIYNNKNNEQYIDNLVDSIFIKDRIIFMTIIIEQIVEFDDYAKNNIANNKYTKNDGERNSIKEKLFSKFIRKRGGSYKNRDTNKHILRSSNEYSQILNFKEYEFSHNVAFLFSKRKIISLFGVEYAHHVRLYMQLFFMNHHIHMSSNNIYNEEEYKEYINNTSIFKNMIISLMKDHLSLNNLIENSYLIHKKELSTLEKVSLSRSHIDLNFNNNSLLKFEQQIHPKFITPSVGYEMNTNYSININLSLPDKELMAYIKHLKYSLLKDYGIISLKELFNGNNPTMEYVIGDILYIYDAVKIGMTYKEIEKSINYYREEVGISSPISEPTIKKYLKYAIFFIDEQNYYSIVDCSFEFDYNEFENIKYS